MILSIPTIISQMITVLYNITDTWFIGRIADENQMAAVTLAFPLFLFITASSNLFGLGGSSLVSRALGNKDLTTAQKGSAFAIYGAIFISLFLSISTIILNKSILHALGADSNTFYYAKEYIFWSITVGAIPATLNPVLAHLIRSRGDSFHASFGMSLGGLLNILFDPLFIFPWGLNLGLAGAAMATTLANLFACIYFCIYIYRKETTFRFSVHPRLLKGTKKIRQDLISVGFPSFIQLFMSVLSNGVLNNQMAIYSPNALAAVGIVKKIDSLPSSVTRGIAAGTLPLIGYNYSLRNTKRMKKAFCFASSIAIGFCSIFFIFVFFFASQTIALFMNEATVIKQGAVFLLLHSFSMPFLALAFMVIALYQSSGNSRPALILSLFRKGLLDIPLMIFLNKIWPMHGLIAAQPIMDIFGFFIALYLYINFWKSSDLKVKI